MRRPSWHKRVQREAADTLAASASIADLIAYFEERSLHDCAAIVREIAKRNGVRETAASLHASIMALKTTRARSQ